MNNLKRLKAIADLNWTNFANEWLKDPTSQQTKELKKIYEYAFNKAEKQSLDYNQKV